MIFAIAWPSIRSWYRDGVDVERHLPELSTYLGHAHITDTYWYLTATPELLQHALLRMEPSEREDLA
jgi:integrase